MAPVVCEGAGPLIDIILRDFILPWFSNVSDDPGRNDVQDMLVVIIGELLRRVHTFLNPVEFALHKGTLLLRHHLAIYGRARRRAKKKHPEVFAGMHTSSFSSSASWLFGPFSSAAVDGSEAAAPAGAGGGGGDGAPSGAGAGEGGATGRSVTALRVEGNERGGGGGDRAAGWCGRRRRHWNRYIAEELLAAHELHPA